MPYRVARSPIHRADETLEPGEVFEPTEAELNAFRDNLVEVEPVEPDPVEPPFDPTEHTVKELEDELDGLDDDELEALRQAEMDGDSRTTALEAIAQAKE